MPNSVSRMLFDSLEPEARLHHVREVRIGLGYTAVQLQDGAVGCAYTFRNALPHGCTVFQDRRPLAGRPAVEVLNYLDSRHPLEAAVGLATANAIANRPRSDWLTGDILDMIRILPADRVGMVGCFTPLVPALRSAVAELFIFEQDLEIDEGLRPAEEAVRRLPECQVALLTATSLINRTVDELIPAVRGCREVVVLGASTPLCPEAFRGTPVTMLSGIVVERPEDLLRVVSEGGGMRMFKGLVRKVNYRLR